MSAQLPRRYTVQAGARYTTGMRMFVVQPRHLLLPILFVLSLLLHLLAIVWLDPRPTPRIAAAGPLTVTLAGAGVATAALPVAAPSVQAPVQAPETAPATPAPQPPALPASEEAATAPAAAAPEPSTASATLPRQDIGPRQRPSQYRTASHDTVRIDYCVSGIEGGNAHLAWETDGSSYRLELEGILGDFVSEGGLDDAGISPRTARERVGTGQATTVFDRARGQIVDGITGRSAQLVPGSQDDASVLLQLSGIGQADPDQLRSRLAFWIGGVNGARMVYFDTAGPERLDTAIGTLDTVRLVRLTDDGAPQLEVWLAPAKAWLPVQLRLTGPDGTVRTQTVCAQTN